MRWPHNRLAQIRKTCKPDGLSNDPLPEAHLLDDLIRSGATKLMPMVGEVALDWQDVWYYHKATGRVADPAERILLKELSEAFVSGKSDGTNPLSISPKERLRE